MESQKIVNLLNDADNESSKFAARKWYVINDQSNTEYGEGNGNDSSIKFKAKVIKSNLCDYSNAYILVEGDITATDGNADTKVAFKNCAPFTRCLIHVNDEHIDTSENLHFIMPMYNLMEYSDIYSDTSGTLRKVKRGEKIMNNAVNPDNVTTDHSTSFRI